MGLPNFDWPYLSKVKSDCKKHCTGVFPMSQTRPTVSKHLGKGGRGLRGPSEKNVTPECTLHRQRVCYETKLLGSRFFGSFTSSCNVQRHGCAFTCTNGFAGTWGCRGCNPAGHPVDRLEFVQLHAPGSFTVGRLSSLTRWGRWRAARRSSSSSSSSSKGAN